MSRQFQRIGRASLLAAAVCPCLAQPVLTASAMELIEGTPCVLTLSEPAPGGRLELWEKRGVRFKITVVGGTTATQAPPTARFRLEREPGGRDIPVLLTRAGGFSAQADIEVGGAFGNYLFRAPHVLAPTDLIIEVGPEGDERESAGVALRILPQVTLGATKTDLRAGSRCQLTPTRWDGQAASWEWSVEGPAARPFQVQALPGRKGRFTCVDPSGAAIPDSEFGFEEAKGGETFFLAPKVAVPAGLVIRVEDTAHSGQSAALRLAIVPDDLGLDGLTIERLLPEVLGTGWSLELGPALEPFRDRGSVQDGSKTLGAVTALRHLDDPAMGPLHGTWLALAANGIWSIPADGKATLVVPEPGIRCIAVRPGDSLEGNPIHVAYVDGQDRIWGLEPGGRRRLLREAGNDRFSRIAGLAVAGDGTLLVAENTIRQHPGVFVEHRESGRIRAISGDGRSATLLAGTDEVDDLVAGVERRLYDDRGARARFGLLEGCALDPSAGYLYVVDTNFLRRVSLDGDVTTWRGGDRWGGLQVVNILGDSRGDTTGQMGRGCHRPGLHQAEVLGGRLLLLSWTDPVQVLDLATGALRNLAEGRRGGASRMGPLPYFSPTLPPEKAAVLPPPAALCTTREGDCLVALDGDDDLQLARLELAGLAGRPSPRISYPSGPVPPGAKVIFTFEDPGGDPPPLEWSASAGRLRVLAPGRVELEVPDSVPASSPMLTVTARRAAGPGAADQPAAFTVPLWVDRSSGCCCVIL